MDYVFALQIPEHVEQLELGELECRCKYADLPVRCVAGGNAVAVDSLPSAKIKIVQNSRVCFEENFRGELQIGRQRMREPRPFSFVGDPVKLIVAGKDDASVSRKQVCLSFHTDQLLVVCNPSSNRAFAVSSP